MRSRRRQKNAMLVALCFATVFLYGCGGSAGVKESSIRLEMLDVTTKAPIENVQVILTAPDPQASGGLAMQVTRQLSTDARGLVVFNDLPPDRTYRIFVSADGYMRPTNNGSDAPLFVPTLPLPATETDGPGLVVEQGKTYTITGYLRRVNAPSTGSIRGYVYDAISGKPITNATAFMQTTVTTTTTAPSRQIQKGDLPAYIDTTDKPSKPGYYELNDIPAGQKTLNITAPGYTPYSNANIVIPSGGTVNWDVNLSTVTGTINFTVRAATGEQFFNYSMTAQCLRNGTSLVAELSQAVTGTTAPFAIQNVPTIPAGSTDTYTLKVISDDARMTNPANGLSGVVLRSTGASAPTLDAGTIVMTPNKGIVQVTIFHDGIETTHTDIALDTLAQMATVTVSDCSSASRFVGENPNEFYTYIVEEVPVGQHTVTVFFPDHAVAAAGNIRVYKDQTTKVIYNTTEGN